MSNKTNQEHVNQVRATLSNEADKFVKLAASSVDTSSDHYKQFNIKMSDAMTELLQAPVK